jgi:UDP-2,3-diacylglucosamine pyrophosphatase LpxH
MISRNKRRDTFRALDDCLKRALRLPGLNPLKGRLVVFSDQHRGDGRSGSDDFLPNLNIYRYALIRYFREGHTLIVNGDSEDCWENDPDRILRAYGRTAYAEEKRFHDAGRGVRIYGNHDREWSDPGKVRRHLRPVLGDVAVHSAALVGDRLLVLHGHQGDPRDDREHGWNRWVVRHLWAPVQRMGWTDRLWPLLRRAGVLDYSRAAANNFIRRERDQLLYEWAKSNRILLIAGHTHRGMFRSFSKVDQIRQMQERLEAALAGSMRLEDRLLILAALERIRDIVRKSREELRRDKSRTRLEKNPVPCYFNAGSCVFSDGITGIEIDRGFIRLVKWEVSDTVCAGEEKRRSNDLFVAIQRKIYQSGDLREIFSRI